jgi:DNA-3-methyladenine glycosylase II
LRLRIHPKHIDIYISLFVTTLAIKELLIDSNLALFQHITSSTIKRTLYTARTLPIYMAPRRSVRISAGLAKGSAEALKTASAITQNGSTSTTASKRKSKASKENGITKKQKTTSTKINVTKKELITEDAAVVPTPDEYQSTPQTPKRKHTNGDVTSIADNSNLRMTPPPLPRLDRPVEPHRTNATLVTPRGSSIVAYPSADDVSPSKTGLPRPIATTGNLLEKALEHLIAVDARLKPVIAKHHCRIFSPEGLAEKIDPFESLASSVIGQQVSGAAARSIKNKFVALFDTTATATTNLQNERPFPTPAQVSQLDIPTLRTAGLSQRKAEYIQGLAEKFSSGELSTQKLLMATDDEVMEMLIAVRGLGRWSVEMFSCFALKRTDVFSTGDLGVQ